MKKKRKKRVFTALAGAALGGVILFIPGILHDSDPVVPKAPVKESFHVTVAGKFRDAAVGKVIEDKENYRDDYFSRESTKAQGGLAKLSLLASASVYNKEYSQKLISDCRFGDVEYVEEPVSEEDNDVVSCQIARRKVEDEQIIAVWVRGTAQSYEWVSNWNLGGENIHQGFALAKEKMSSRIEEYLKKKKITVKKGEKIKFWITGHSRGAAVANLYAKQMTDVLGKKNVYAYTFATPRVSREAKKDGYENIFNYMNDGDFVTAIAPEDWGYGRYGADRVMETGADTKSGKLYQKIGGKEYQGFTSGEKDDLLRKILDYAGSGIEDYYREKLGFSPAFFFQKGLGYFLAGNHKEAVANASLVLLTNQDAAPIINVIMDEHFTARLAAAHAPLIYLCELAARYQ